MYHVGLGHVLSFVQLLEHLTRTVLPINANFYRHIHTDMLCSHTGHDATDGFR